MKRTAKADKFPLVVKSGSSAVKIYRDIKPGGEYFRVVYYLGGKRERLNFKTLDEARTEAAAKAAQLARGDVDAMQLNGKDRLAYGRALDAVRPFGMELDAAAIEYAEARKVLGGFSLAEAARFYMKHHGRGTVGKNVSDAVQDFKDAKKEAGRSDLYLKDISYRLGGLSKAFRCEVRQMTQQDVEDFMSGLKLAPRSFNNHALLLRTFFKFCQSRGWLSRDTDLLATIERRTEKKGAIDIFTPAEMAKLLKAAAPRVAACIAIQGFAGVRTAELFRLKWADLERRAGHIEISAGVAKTASRRLIPISDNLVKWLEKAPRVEGNDHVWPVAGSEYYERLAKTADDAGLEWKANALRHSFISYRLAILKDVAAVALEAGNSPKMVFAHYRELCTEAEAKEWFGIIPKAKE